MSNGQADDSDVLYQYRPDRGQYRDPGRAPRRPFKEEWQRALGEEGLMWCHHFDREIADGECSICSGSTARTTGGGGFGVASIEFDLGTVVVDAPYNEDFIADLKKAVPGYARSWDGQQRVWVVAGEWWDVAEEIVTRYFVLVE